MRLTNSLFKKTIFASALTLFATLSNATVLTSIKPLGFISAAIADGVTDTQVLVPAGASPHDYSLKPSDIQKIKSAELVVWIGEDIDSFLSKSIEGINRKNVLTIADIKGIEPLLSDHDHKHSHNHGHSHDHSLNWHIWFSPEISQLVAISLAEKLSEQYPDKKQQIADNLATFQQHLADKNQQIMQQLAPVKDKGFYVFHDAYTYFNENYGLNQVGYFTINPLVAPGARTLATIKQQINEHKVACLFAEPQFTPKVIETLSKETGVAVGKLDPIGEAISLSKTSYMDFLQHMADDYYACLSGKVSG
ncbi:zinc ABC transporter substrate-binding protein ZnuA [Volucribacter amazonae]|uniref:High-affinity zinc uptake system protein ZnuA n=1 Tax=Volucribacter amazonae TaxID=256731 RepID=A0A9X4PA14_9PAST|nr:zinc ABC transporter substrate-binding protein ZnuA [Volucribacter amazonae]MDG6894472.1 zinc ABC transporter substrate-binding protein [Volucribacter amazonae]